MTALFVGLYLGGWLVTAIQTGRIIKGDLMEGYDFTTVDALICSAIGLFWLLILPVVLVAMVVKKIVNEDHKL